MMAKKNLLNTKVTAELECALDNSFSLVSSFTTMCDGMGDTKYADGNESLQDAESNIAQAKLTTRVMAAAAVVDVLHKSKSASERSKVAKDLLAPTGIPTSLRERIKKSDEAVC